MTERFRMATLLKVLEDRRSALREELSQADQALAILEGQVQQIDQDALDRLQAIRQSVVGQVDVDWIVSNRRHAFVLKLQRTELLRNVDLVKEERERRRVALMEADREVKKLERMQEQWQEHRQQEQQRKDQQRLDELSIIGFFRNSEASQQLGEEMP